MSLPWGDIKAALFERSDLVLTTIPKHFGQKPRFLPDYVSFDKWNILEIY
jgi:hypothetical protein